MAGKPPQGPFLSDKGVPPGEPVKGFSQENRATNSLIVARADVHALGVSFHREEQEIHHKVTKDTKVRVLFFLVTFVSWW